jgi:hypothetical protein
MSQETKPMIKYPIRKTCRMHRLIIIALLSTISIPVFSQETAKIDSIQKSFKKLYRKSVKFLWNKNDTSMFVTAYNKTTHEVLGVMLLIKGPYKNTDLPIGQYHYYFPSEKIVLLRVTADHSDGRHVGRAEYLFLDGVLLSKKQDNYIERDFSGLYSSAGFYKQLAAEYIREKFTK